MAGIMLAVIIPNKTAEPAIRDQARTYLAYSGYLLARFHTEDAGENRRHGPAQPLDPDIEPDDRRRAAAPLSRDDERQQDSREDSPPHTVDTDQDCENGD